MHRGGRSLGPGLTVAGLQGSEGQPKETATESTRHACTWVFSKQR